VSEITIKKTFRIPIYFGKLIVVATDNLQAAADGMALGFDTQGFGALASQRTTKNGLREYAILIGPNCTLKDVVHECVHVANFIMKFIGISPDLDNDEPQCYLVGWIFGCAASVFSKYEINKQK